MSASTSKHQQAKRCPKPENHGTPRKTQWKYSICALACMTLCLSLHDFMQFWLFESGLDWTCSPALRNADRTDIWWKSREFACSMRFDDDRNGQIDYIESLGNGHMNIWNIHLKTPRHKHWRRPPWHGRVLFYYFLLCPCPLRVFQGFFFSGVERAKRQEHLRGVGTSELVAQQPVEHGSEPCDVSGRYLQCLP